MSRRSASARAMCSTSPISWARRYRRRRGRPRSAARYCICSPVWRFRSPHYYCRGFVTRTSKPKPHQNHKFTGVPWVLTFVKVPTATEYDARIGTLARRRRLEAVSRRSFVFRDLAKGLAGGKRLQSDQPRVFHGGLPVFDRLAIDRVADHLDEGGNARIFGDEAVIPVFL